MNRKLSHMFRVKNCHNYWRELLLRKASSLIINDNYQEISMIFILIKIERVMEWPPFRKVISKIHLWVPRSLQESQMIWEWVINRCFIQINSKIKRKVDTIFKKKTLFMVVWVHQIRNKLKILLITKLCRA